MSGATIDSARFVFEPAPLTGLWVVRDKPLPDARGAFARLYCANEWRAIGLTVPLVQINRSVTAVAGTVRGMHFQHPPHAETKAIRCLSGAVFDVAVDVRAGSPTYLHWFGLRLAAGDNTSLIVPPGFAHGFQALEPDSALMYFVSAAFDPLAEDGLHPLDPALEIEWPMACALLSDKDRARPFLSDRTFRPVQERTGG